MKKRSCLFFWLILLCGASLSWAGEVPEYSITADIDPQARRITARQTVAFTNTTSRPTDSIYFHIYPNRSYTAREKAFMARYASYFNINPYPEGFMPASMNVTRVSVDGQDLPAAVEGEDKSILKIKLQKPLKSGERIVLQMNFTADIPVAYGRYGTIGGITALSRWYPILSVLEEKGWDNHPFYPFQRPFHSEAALYTVQVTVPAGTVVIHSGSRTGERVINGKTEVRMEAEKPLRDFAMAVSDKYAVEEETRGGIRIKAYYLPGGQERAREAINNAAGLMDYYAERFSPYPYSTFSIAPVHLGYGGEQMSNLIFIDTRVFDLPKALNRYFDFMIAHETGHQWFYALVGVNDYTQMWLEEGINSYFLLEYLEHKYGENARVLTLPPWTDPLLPALTFRRASSVRYKMQARIGFERPIMSDLSSFHEPSTIFSLTYGKGSRVVAMLKDVVGTEAFDRIFRRIFKEYAFRNLDIEDFRRIAQEESGKDLSSFFDQWLYTTKHLDAGVYGVKGNAIAVRRRGGITLPVKAAVTHTDGTQEVLTWDSEEVNGVLRASKPVKQVRLDPGQQMLDIDRTNDSWPRAFHIKPVPLYLPIYDIPALMPDDGYNIVVGPEMAYGGLGIKTTFQKPYDYMVTAATDYDWGSQIQRTRIGFDINNVFRTQTTLGVEKMHTKDYDTGEDDLVSDKIYLRRELWPAPYSLTDVNDHLTLYALRNRTPSGTFKDREYIRNTSYLRRNESIVGAAVHFDRSRPRPDPLAGYGLDLLVENSGHWGGATQAFTRASADGQVFHSVTVSSVLAGRFKYGWGSAGDKNLYQIGGPDGLRGYDIKTVRGANMLLGSAEYRFPIIDHSKLNVLDHWLTLHKVSGVAFFDGGNAWYEHMGDAKFRKDAGLGLRLHITVGAILQDVLVRMDVAQAINDRDEDNPRAWFGINHAF